MGQTAVSPLSLALYRQPIDPLLTCPESCFARSFGWVPSIIKERVKYNLYFSCTRGAYCFLCRPALSRCRCVSVCKRAAFKAMRERTGISKSRICGTREILTGRKEAARCPKYKGNGRRRAFWAGCWLEGTIRCLNRPPKGQE